MLVVLSSSIILFIVYATILSYKNNVEININLFTNNQKLIINVIISFLIFNHTNFVIFYNIIILSIQLFVFVYHLQNNKYKLFMYFCGLTSLILFLTFKKFDNTDKISIYLFSQIILFI
jgi:hypothetical protein